jgi:hypothetical protein
MVIMTSKSNGSGTVPGLFGSALNDGVLSQAALNAISVNDIGADINAALGVSVDDVQASEVTLLTPLADDSSSINQIREDPNDPSSRIIGPELIRSGHNLIVEALSNSKQKDAILISSRLLNRGLVYPYTMISAAPKFDDKNYRAGGSTPLYDQSLIVLGTVIAKWQDFINNGCSCRTITPIITDGADWGSRKTAADVAKVIKDMLKQECHIIAGVGIADGSTDFEQIFLEMGIPREWILTPKNTASDIRRTFNMLSQSAQRLSQTVGGNFSQAAMGGFGTP